MTLVPAMAETAAHVTMLQRTPTWIAALPAIDKISLFLKRFLPESAVYKQARARNVLVQRLMYALSRRRPELSRKLMLAGVRKHLGKDADLSAFTPDYNPWDQRLCVVPDGDLFDDRAQRPASVVTDTIETFTRGRHPAHVRPRAARRRGRHRDRTESAAVRRRGNRRGRRARRRARPRHLQGRPARTRPERRDDLRLHQRVLDAQGRHRQRVRVPAAQPHDRARLHARRRAAPPRASTPAAAFSARSTPATCAAATRALPRQGTSAPWQVTNNYLQRPAPAPRGRRGGRGARSSAEPQERRWQTVPFCPDPPGATGATSRLVAEFSQDHLKCPPGRPIPRVSPTPTPHSVTRAMYPIDRTTCTPPQSPHCDYCAFPHPAGDPDEQFG